MHARDACRKAQCPRIVARPEMRASWLQPRPRAGTMGPPARGRGSETTFRSGRVCRRRFSARDPKALPRRGCKKGTLPRRAGPGFARRPCIWIVCHDAIGARRRARVYDEPSPGECHVTHLGREHVLYVPAVTAATYSPDEDVVVILTSPVSTFLIRTSTPARGPLALERAPRISPWSAWVQTRAVRRITPTATTRVRMRYDSQVEAVFWMNSTIRMGTVPSVASPAGRGLISPEISTFVFANGEN